MPRKHALKKMDGKVHTQEEEGERMFHTQDIREHEPMHLPHGHSMVLTHSFMDGQGVTHHIHHHLEGGDIGGWFKRLGRKIRSTFSPIEQGVKKTFTPQLGRDIAGTLIHKGIPALTGTIGSALGSMVGPLTGVAGGTAGTMLGNMAGDALGKQTGLGLKKARKGRFEKGSAEAKEHMRKIREMRGKGVPAPHSRLPITDPMLMGSGLGAGMGLYA